MQLNSFFKCNYILHFRVRVNADEALLAANSYKKIVDALHDARTAAREAFDASLRMFKVTSDFIFIIFN